MPLISESDYEKMKDSYRSDVAGHLAELAMNRQKITYSELSAKFGGSHRRWGDTLGGIAIRCHEKGLPLLPVIVVKANTRLPSDDADLYKDLGLKSEADVISELQRCFDTDWSETSMKG